jgi:hypothetical protein
VHVNLNANPGIDVANAMTAYNIPAISNRHDSKEMRERERERARARERENGGGAFI